MTLKELTFARLTALALEIPASILLQSASVCSNTSSSGSTSSWVEGSVVIERSIIDGCTPIARMLEASLIYPLNTHTLRHISSTPTRFKQELMVKVYREIYKSEPPTFRVRLDPTVTMENMVSAFDNDMMSAPDTSRIMKSNMGTELSKDAESARSERRKAANVLPFRDKQDT